MQTGNVRLRTPINLDVPLGQKIFLVNEKAEIVRTMVSQLYVDEHATLVSNTLSDEYLTFEEAAAAAKARLLGLCNEPSANAIELGGKLDALDGRAYRDQIMNAPLVYDTRTSFLGLKTLTEEPTVPEKYFKPGEVVYAVITTETKRHSISIQPRPFFVLQSTVQSVEIDFTKSAAILYRLRSDFFTQDLYETEREAKHALVKAFNTITDGHIEFVKVMVVSEEEEADYNTNNNRLTYERLPIRGGDERRIGLS